MTLREYLRKLHEASLKNRRLANFLREHDLVGTIRKSPHWRRNAKYYNRGKSWSA